MVTKWVGGRVVVENRDCGKRVCNIKGSPSGVGSGRSFLSKMPSMYFLINSWFACNMDQMLRMW